MYGSKDRSPEVTSVPMDGNKRDESPEVSKRICALKDIQTQYYEVEHSYNQERTAINAKYGRPKKPIYTKAQYDDFVAEFNDDIAALEHKYEKLYRPLHIERYKVVNGIAEVGGHSTDESAAKKAIPEFWLTAMKNHKILAKEINERDEEPLKYLKDIRRFSVDYYSDDFRLEFYFNRNPFFKNSVLKKIYHLADENEACRVLKAIGTEIQWHPGQCLTNTVVEKKRKAGSDAQPSTKTKPCKSFFDFFSPRNFPGDDDNYDSEDFDDVGDIDDNEDYDDEIDYEKIEQEMDHDYKIGVTIANYIIRSAVLWYTGDGSKGMKDDYDDDEDDHDDEE